MNFHQTTKTASSVKGKRGKASLRLLLFNVIKKYASAFDCHGPSDFVPFLVNMMKPILFNDWVRPWWNVELYMYRHDANEQKKHYSLWSFALGSAHVNFDVWPRPNARYSVDVSIFNLQTPHIPHVMPRIKGRESDRGADCKEKLDSTTTKNGENVYLFIYFSGQIQYF